MPGTNALAHNEKTKLTAVKSFVILAPVRQSASGRHYKNDGLLFLRNIRSKDYGEGIQNIFSQTSHNRSLQNRLSSKWRHDTQYKDNQHKDNQHKDNQHKDNQHKDNQHKDKQHKANQHKEKQHEDN